MYIDVNARKEKKEEKRCSLDICFGIPIFQITQIQCQYPVELNNAAMCNMEFTFSFLHVNFFTTCNFTLLYLVHYSSEFQYPLASKSQAFLALGFFFLNSSITNPLILTISVESNCSRAKVASFKVSHLGGLCLKPKVLQRKILMTKSARNQKNTYTSLIIKIRSSIIS